MTVRYQPCHYSIIYRVYLHLILSSFLSPSLPPLSLSLPQSATHVDVSGGKDLHKEYARQREHMERTVASLRKKLTKDSEIHRSDTVRVMHAIIG